MTFAPTQPHPPPQIDWIYPPPPPPPPPHNFSYLCFSFLLGINVLPRVIKNNAYAQFLGGKQGVLWEMSKWQNSRPQFNPVLKICAKSFI